LLWWKITKTKGGGTLLILLKANLMRLSVWCGKDTRELLFSREKHVVLLQRNPSVSQQLK
jgi:hypothetical protein